MATAYLTSLQINYFDSVIIAGIQQLKSWEKRARIDHAYKEAVKTSNIILVQIQYLFSRLITLVREGEVISKLYRNTVTKIINSKTLRANEEIIN